MIIIGQDSDLADKVMIYLQEQDYKRARYEKIACIPKDNAVLYITYSIRVFDLQR